MTTWADIQRLASDLQRVQLASAAQKLSENNCIELVTRLLEAGNIDVVYTRDGSAYITKAHLVTMVANEVAACGGRLALPELATRINVHLEHVEGIIGRLTNDGQYQVSNGELISRQYVTHLHSQLRSLLIECGLRSISFLARHWNLPVETLTSLITPLPSDLEAIQEGDQIYTNVYMQSHKNRLRAVFSAITKVTPLSSIMTQCYVPSSRMNALVDELLSEGEITGRFSGSRSSPSSLFIPSIHDRLVELFIKKSIRQNEYIENSIFRKLTLGEPKTALTNILGTAAMSDLHFLPSLVCTDGSVDKVKCTLNEELSQKGYADGVNVLAEAEIPFTNDDVEAIMKEMKIKDEKLAVEGDLLFTGDIMTRAVNEIKSSTRLEEKASEWVEKRMEKKGRTQEKEKDTHVQKKTVTVVDDDDDDWDEKPGKKGKAKKGGAPKSTKAPKGTNTASTSVKDDDKSSVPHVSTDEIESWLESVPEALRPIVAERILPEVESALASSVATRLANREQEAAQSTKKAHQQMRTGAQDLFHRIVLFEQGAATCGDALGSDLHSFLLKSLCTQLSTDLLLFSSGTCSGATLTQKQREDTVNGLGATAKNAFTALFASLKGDSMDVFHDSLQEVCSRTICDLPLNQPDKETKCRVEELYMKGLSEEATKSEESAVVLLSLLLLVYAQKHILLHASGKFVSQLVHNAKELVDERVLGLLGEAQSLVVASLKGKAKGGGDEEEKKERLKEVLEDLKTSIIERLP